MEAVKLNTQKFMWIYDNIERYKFHGSEALAIKKEYCWILFCFRFRC